jgi:hypothetical protein
MVASATSLIAVLFSSLYRYYQPWASCCGHWKYQTTKSHGDQSLYTLELLLFRLRCPQAYVLAALLVERTYLQGHAPVATGVLEQGSQWGTTCQGWWAQVHDGAAGTRH